MNLGLSNSQTLQDTLFTKMEIGMTTYNPQQQYLIPPEAVFGLNPALLGCFPSKIRGRPPVSKEALLNVLIYKNVQQLPTLFDLASTLIDTPRLAIPCGLAPNKSLNSIEERLSSFREDIPNRLLHIIRVNLINQLIELKEISDNFLSIDSAAVPVVVRENNLKTSMNDRFDKSKPPKGGHKARVGVMISFTNPFQKEPRYFWGYRNHSITDCNSELPVWEVTKPANVHNTPLFILLFKKLREYFSFTIQAVMGDAAYDSEGTTFGLLSMSSMPCPELPGTHGGKNSESSKSPLQELASVSLVLRCSPGESSQIEGQSVRNLSAPYYTPKNSLLPDEPAV